MLNQMYEQYCANRLPCGICRLTNSQCPKIFATAITCNPCGDAVPTTTATTTASITYDGVKRRSTWASVNTKEDPK